MIITKSKLPKGFTYPLKSSLLKNSLEAAGISLPVTLRYETNAELVVASYFFPRTWEDYEKIHINSGSVKSRDSVQAREHLDNIVIPEFIVWLNGNLKSPDNSSKYTGHNSAQWISPRIGYTKKGF